jgi:hypothetical protein
MGYICNPGDEITILTNQLSNGSNYKINVICDLCLTKKELVYHKYIKNINNGGYYSCSNKCSVDKYKKKMLETYNVINIFQLDEIKEKSKNTRFEKYGDVNYNNYVKAIETKKENINSNIDNFDWIMYKKLSRRLYRKIRVDVIKNWNGIDFYDNEYIKDNLKLNFHDKNYPTVDHKMSVYEGFLNNIPVDIINSLDNLVVTKRYINSIKGYKIKKETF